MQAFNTAYPWIVLSFGVFDAFLILATGFFGAVTFMVEPDFVKRWDTWDRIWPSGVILLLTTVSACGMLAATRGILNGV